MAEIVVGCGCVVTWHKDEPLRSEVIYCPRHDTADEMYEALHFARSVIKSGEQWSDTCEEMITGTIVRADGDKAGGS